MRRFEAELRPEIENHFHIRELIERQEARASDRSDYQDRAKRQEERMRDIKAADAKTVKAFYCNQCEDDFFAEAIKEVEIDWSNTAQYIAFYRTTCFQGHRCMRLITDPLRDSYFFESKKVAQDRAKHAEDMLQPFQTGFNTLYGKK